MANGTGTGSFEQAMYYAYTTRYEHVMQEKKPWFMDSFTMDTIEGEQKAYNYLGTTEFEKKTAAFEDVPLDNIAQNRRWIDTDYYHRAVLLDADFNHSMIADPSSSFIQALTNGAIRIQNAVAAAAPFADVKGGKDAGDTTHSFENDVMDVSSATGGRTIVHDAQYDYTKNGTKTGLTIDKLILARQAWTLLDGDPDELLHVAVNPRQISDLVRSAELQDIDTSPFKALVNGITDTVYKFKFIQTNRVTLGTNNDVDEDEDVYECPVWSKDGLVFARNLAPTIKVDRLPRKDCDQLMCKVSCAAIRTDEDKVFKIECASTTS